MSVLWTPTLKLVGFFVGIFIMGHLVCRMELYNEILAAARVKSAEADEIFGVPPQMKLNPSALPAKRDFITK